MERHIIICSDLSASPSNTSSHRYLPAPHCRSSTLHISVSPHHSIAVVPAAKMVSFSIPISRGGPDRIFSSSPSKPRYRPRTTFFGTHLRSYTNNSATNDSLENLLRPVKNIVILEDTYPPNRKAQRKVMWSNTAKVEEVETAKVEKVEMMRSYGRGGAGNIRMLIGSCMC